jgi:NAD(P)-dependent dehydrogenase (short-subunit alcohol dehydrogenase family)
VEKGERAKESIVESTNCKADVIEVWPLDLCSYESVKSFAARASRELERIDVLLENAGISLRTWDWAEDNEKTVTVNVISTFLLAFLLLPKLKQTAVQFQTRPVLTVVSSEAHLIVDFVEKDAPEGIFNNLNDKSKANMDDRYPVSKLMEIFIVREMAAQRPSESYPVTINTVNPGLCASELNREGILMVRIMMALLARTIEAGSRTLVAGACGGPDTHGEYMDMCKVAPTASLVTSPTGEKAQKRVWDELMQKLETIVPGVTGNL